MEDIIDRYMSITSKDSDLHGDALLDSISDSQTKTKTNTRETENVQGENDEESLNHIIKKDPTEAICEVKPDGRAHEEGGHSEENKGNIHERKCDPCSFDNIEESAASFCVVCVEYLCKGCTRDHRRSKATRSHRILIDDEIPMDPAVFKMMKSLMYCCDHPEMEVLFKCKTHDKFICNKCLVISHRKCEEVKEISDPAPHVQSTISGDNTSASGIMQAVYDMTVSVRTSKEENIEKLRLDHACIIKEQSEFMKSIEEHLLKLDEKSKIEMENMITKELNDLEKEVVMCRKIENVEKEKIGLLNVAMKYGSTVELNVISELVTKEAEDFEQETKKQAEKAVVRLQFVRNQSLADIATTGTVSVVRGEKKVVQQDKNPRNIEVLEKSSDGIDETSSNARISPAEKTTISNSDKPKCPLLQSSVSKTRTMYDLHKTNAIWRGSLTRILVLSDGRLVVTDHHNQCIKILNIDMTVNMQFELDGNPIDVCQFSKNHLAIILDGERRIKRLMVVEGKVYNLGGFLSKLYPISIEKYGESGSHVIILFSNTPKDIDSDSSTIEMQIRSVHNGEILIRMTDFQTKSSDKLILKNPSRIQMMPNVQNAFLISESEKLHYFELGKTNYTINEKWYCNSNKASNIDRIGDIAVDKEGNIYVCGYDSKNIHQISGTNFKNIRVLLSVPGTPQSICVDDDRRRLIIGCEDDDFTYIVATMKN